jgi:membrane protein implicated in regulation of membrane protease activity
MWWSIWWVWVMGALVLGFLEVLVPSWIFLGFAIGAAVTGGLLGAGGAISAQMSASLPMTCLIFAVLSLAAWLLLRRAVGVRKGQVKVWDRDINED